MPTVEKVNYEMTRYLQDIEEYIEKYKRLPKKEVKKQAKENLMNAGIIAAQMIMTGLAIAFTFGKTAMTEHWSGHRPIRQMKIHPL